LGALLGGVVRLVLWRELRLVFAGVVAGVALSLWLSGFVAPLRFGLQPRDPMTLSIAAVTLAAIGMFAGWLPASRASRINPAEVLRDSPTRS
jgi:putative ABC transport system permease protein